MKRVALFVGVDKYEDGNIRNLDYAGKDAGALANAFKTFLGFDTVRELQNPGTEWEVLGKVRELKKGLGPGDLFVFYFAGHGVRREADDEYRLVCAGHQYDYLMDGFAGLLLKLLKKELRGPWDRMLIIDACQNDPRKTRAAGACATSRDLELILEDGAESANESGVETVVAGSQVVVTSCSEGETALEIDTEQHGLFTKALLDMVVEHVRYGRRLAVENFLGEMAQRMKVLAVEHHLHGVQKPKVHAPIDCGIVLLDGMMSDEVDGGGHLAAGRVATGTCAKCGAHPLLTAMFDCPKCGRTLCEAHRGQGTYWCEDCASAGKGAEDARKSEGATVRREEVDEAETASPPETGTRRVIDLGGGVALEMVACPDVAVGFWMGRYPVTQEQWQHVTGTNPARSKNKPTHPVVYVSWNACKKFVDRLNALPVTRQSGLRFRLPTEAEWQKACRAGAPRTEEYCRLADGTQITRATLGRVAWFGEHGRKGGTHPVGQKEPNAWGLYDMHGNVSEWVRPANRWGQSQKVCGGSFDAGSCEVNGGWTCNPGDTRGDIGFRLAAYATTGDSAELERIRRAAEEGDADAQLKLGRLFEEGRWVGQDDEEALKWVLAAAEQGVAEAQVEAGEWIQKGRGGAKANEKKAVTWYRAAAMQKSAEGQYRLGMCYLEGRGLQPNEKTAANWFRKAAAQGHEAAAATLLRTEEHLAEQAREAAKAREAAAKTLERAEALRKAREAKEREARKKREEELRKEQEEELRKEQEAAAAAAEAAHAQGKAGGVTQADIARQLVESLGLSSALSATPSDAEVFASLMRNGIVPADGWDATAAVSKADLARVLVQALGAQDTVANPADAGAWLTALEEQGISLWPIGQVFTELELRIQRKREEEKSASRMRARRKKGLWGWLFGGSDDAGSASAVRARPGIRRRAGDTMTLTLPGGATIEMVWCPPGTFMMGSPVNEDRRQDNETQHRVTLTKGFWMGKYLVTQAQWKSVMGGNPSHFNGDDLPVENVSWDASLEFCRKAGLALPTEAQWEYACRAGSTEPFAGSGRLEDMGWYDGNSFHQTQPVGQKRPNAWGLYDMHGNVWEWCADWYDDYSRGAVTDPTGASSGSGRVIRGGSWWNYAEFCRSAFRAGDDPNSRDSRQGLRVALLSVQ